MLIDFPDFNLRLAQIAHSLQIPVLYYVSPQVWAWRRGRVRQIARWVNRMAVVFPFEVAFYESARREGQVCRPSIVGNRQVTRDRESVLKQHGLDPAKPTIALLPGSRHGEVSRHLHPMLGAATRLQQERTIQFLCVCASTINPDEIRAAIEQASLKIPVVTEERYDAVSAADLVWTASGTATLETALLGKPMIIVYRMSWLTYLLARLLVRVDHIGMVNLIAGERLMPELVQSEFTAERLAAESRVMLDDAGVRSRIIEKLSQLRDRLGSPGAAERVADLALAMMS